MKRFIKKISLVTALIFTSVSLCSCSGLINYLLVDEEEPTWQANAQLNDNEDSDTDEELIEADSFTLMVYICGSDLESADGAATADLNEMLYANLTDKLNVIVQTGGTEKWQNNIISADSVQRYKLTANGITLVDDIGQQCMTKSSTLADFIAYAKTNFPADRYGLIMWDHGGGTMGGYGADENYEYDSMNISQIADGLKAGGCSFDFIGFDCCLMATIATAKAMSPYAKYLIASEETEPGSGWYYTNFLSLLAEDPSISVKDLSYTIISDYIDKQNTYVEGGVTLSLVDLRQIDHVLSKLYAYLSNSREYLQEGHFQNLSYARSGARSYGDNGFDQIDIIDYVTRTEVNGGTDLVQALNRAIILNGTNMTGSNGLAMYYPYSMPDDYGTVTDFTDDIGLDAEYYNAYFNDFISVMAGGQYYGGGTSNPYTDAESSQSSSFDDFDWFNWDWFNSDLVEEYNENDEYYYVDSSELEITPKGDIYVLQLSDEDWELVTEIELQVYVDDGEGFLALGSDNLFEFDDDGDLIIDFDYTWTHLNGSLVTYYVMYNGERTDGSTYSIGCIPALLNGEKDIYIWVHWENQTGEYEILGYREDMEYTVSPRGYRTFKDGDVIDFYFDYYDYNGDYDGAYFLEDNWLVYYSSKGLEITYEDIGDVETQVCFWLQDIYGNDYWTEPLTYTID